MRHLFLGSFVLALIAAEGCNSAVPPTAPDAAPVEAGIATPPAGSGVSLKWVGVGHGVQGSVRVNIQNNVARLEFSEDFSVAAVPGPFIYVNTTNNANTGIPLRISALRANSGAQSYVVQVTPGTQYMWVLIWCDPFNVAVAEARIPVTP